MRRKVDGWSTRKAGYGRGLYYRAPFRECVGQESPMASRFISVVTVARKQERIASRE